MGSCCSSCCSFFFGCCGHQTHDPKGTTLVADRGCTDKLILLLYIAATALTVVVISLAATGGGDPYKIINGVDYNGNICGHSSATKDYPLAALVNPLTTDSDSFSVWTCVKTCNETENPNNIYFANNYGSSECQTHRYAYRFINCSSSSELFSSMFYPFSSMCIIFLSVFGYCVPTFNVDASGSVNLNFKSQFDDQFDSASANITRGMSDLANAWAVILMSAFFALFFSYVYIWLTRKFAGIIIWLCIILVIVGGFFLGWSFLKAADESDVSDTSDRRVQAYKVAGYIFIALTALFILIILGLSSQISIAIEVVKEGSRAINDMRGIVFLPLLPLAICGGYIVYWIYGALYIFSISDKVDVTAPDAVLTYGQFHANTGERTGIPQNYTTYDINSSYRPLAAYWVFHGLWTVQFFVYFGYFVLAGAVCGWYFTMSDENGNKMFGGEKGGSRTPILASLWRTIRYHIGTIAFAALIIAVVQFIRVTVKYIELKTRSNPPNHLQKAIFCIIQCCLKCIECCLDKISKNALVWTAMWGDPFLSAACSSFALIWRNLARVAAVHVVSDIILLIGKLSIAAMSVGLSALILQNASPWKNTVSSAFVPCILIAVLSYFVAWLFFLTFETIIDTTFLCFLVDAENAEKNKEAMFASKGLQTLVGKYQLRSAMVSETKKQEAAEMYRAVNGQKVQEHQEAVAQLNRAVSTTAAKGEQAAHGGTAPASGKVSDSKAKSAWS